MHAMTLTLPSELQGFVEEKVKTGAFSSDAEVIRAAVTMMKNSDGEYEQQLKWLRDAIDVGWDQAKAGQLLTPDEVWTRLEERKRQWLAARGLHE